MTGAREEILARVRRALADRPAGPTVPRDYRGAGATPLDDPVAVLAERLEDYRATVHRCARTGVARVVAALLDGTVAVPDGFPASWLPAAVEAVRDEPPLSTSALDGVATVLTTCALAVALTGTIVLDHGPGQGRRALTLVPDHHVVVVRTDRIVANVPDALTRLDPTRPLTWISGPSATSDIELERVEGVHGPRRLDVVIVQG